MTLRIALVAVLLLSATAQAEILFEAFYRIEKGGRHTGYLIQRLATGKGEERVLSTYIRSRDGDSEFYTTSRSVAKAGNAEPVETAHTTGGSGAIPYTILSKFKNGKATINYHSNNSRKPSLTETAQIAPYPSAFMYFVADFPKFQPGKKYAYSAFFESQGETQIGQLSVLGAKPGAGHRVLQILNDDSGQPVEGFVADNGEPLGSRSTATNTVVFWVATKEEAVADMTYPTGEMTKLFGDLPQGRKNIWSKSPGFRSLSIIESLTAWDGARSISSSPASSVLPLPLRKLP